MAFDELVEGLDEFGLLLVELVDALVLGGGAVLGFDVTQFGEFFADGYGLVDQFLIALADLLFGG